MTFVIVNFPAGTPANALPYTEAGVGRVFIKASSHVYAMRIDVPTPATEISIDNSTETERITAEEFDAIAADPTYKENFPN